MEICIKWTMCRTCTTDCSSQLQPLYNDPNLAKQLQEYAGISVNPDDGLPDHICTACIENLQLVHTFLSGCKEADEHLRTVVNRTMSQRICFKSLSIESELSEESLPKVGTEARMRKQIISERKHVHLHQKSSKPTQENEKSKRESPQISEDEDGRNEELKLKSTGSSVKKDDDYLLVINSTQDQMTDSEVNEYIITDVTDNDYDEDDTQMEAANKTETYESDNNSFKVEHPSIDLGAACEPSSFSRHSCSMCGNSFPNQTQLKSHLRTHGNEKIYECELCNKRFNAACNLTTHMRTHTGEKPYACAYCGRRFADRSTHRKHERMHTNEKPYACDICSKSFSLSTTLKAHFLSHSQERPHKCLTCNKGFRLPHQLKAHEKSHVHRYEVGVMLYNQEEYDYSKS